MTIARLASKKERSGIKPVNASSQLSNGSNIHQNEPRMIVENYLLSHILQENAPVDNALESTPHR